MSVPLLHGGVLKVVSVSIAGVFCCFGDVFLSHSGGSFRFFGLSTSSAHPISLLNCCHDGREVLYYVGRGGKDCCFITGALVDEVATDHASGSMSGTDVEGILKHTVVSQVGVTPANASAGGACVSSTGAGLDDDVCWARAFL